MEFGVIGIKNEVALADFLREKVGESVCLLSGKTTIDILPAVLEKATLLITNDSGPSHIARAIGIPTVTLAGPSQPAYFTIKGTAEISMIYHPVSCAPCLKDSCDKMDCWKEISVEEVFEATARMLTRVSHSRPR
jgi:ADP-heptose:LPS heptosyltransferase